MQTRHYSPEFGRFLQPDPTAAEANLYGYAGNGPVTRVDPDGRLFWFVAIAVAVARVVVPRIIRVLPRLGVVTRATRQAVPRARAVFQRYSDHALDRMSQHGVSRAMVEKTIQRGVCFFDPLHRSLVFVIQLQRHWLGVAIDPYSRKIITILWDDTRKGVVKTRFLQGRYPCP